MRAAGECPISRLGEPMKRAIAPTCVMALVLLGSRAEARITSVEIKSVELTFDGRTFGPNSSVGAYQKIRGTAHGEVDPADLRNAIITDIGLAPRTLGKVGS